MCYQSRGIRVVALGVFLFVLAATVVLNVRSKAMTSETENPVLIFVQRNIERYPRSEVRDIYKLLYQSFYGAGHAVNDIDSAREWLMDEWEEVSPVEQDERHPLLEPIFITTDDEIPVTPPLYRLHLGTARAMGIDPEIILQEFIRCADGFPRAYPTEDDDPDRAFRAAWSEVGKFISSGKIELGLEDYAAFSAEVEQAGWRAVHHSETYRREYDPHYRLVMDMEIFDGGE